MSTRYCSTSDLCNALNLEGVDARRAAVLTRMIETAETMVDRLCGCSFDEEVREEELWGQGSYDLFPNSRNITEIIWAGYDSFNLISITAAICHDMIIEKNGQDFAITLDGTRHETTFSYTNTLNDVVAWINNSTTGLVAELEDTDIGDYPAWAIWNQFETYAEGGDAEVTMYFEGAMMSLKCARRTNEWLKSTTTICEDTRVKLVYKSGYATIPSAIREATILAASMLYRSTQLNPNVSSEKLGDWAIGYRAPQDITSGIENTIRPLLAEYILLAL